MSKWKSAHYEQGGEWYELLIEDLANAENIPNEKGRIRDLELWDEAKEYRLFPRFRKGSPHFFCRVKRIREFKYRSETDEAHQERIETHLNTMGSCNWLVGSKCWTKDFNGEFVGVFTLKNYKLGKEITRALTDSIRYRHDIFGAYDSLSTSARFPLFAIEVIKSSYPCEETFQAWLAISKIHPYFIAFDHLDKTNYIFQLQEKENRIRTIFYIYDGDVWKNGERLEDCDTANKFKSQLEQIIA